LLQSFGIHATEAELARQCFTYSGGTESWYLARALREHGLIAEYVFMPQSSRELPVPSIAGVKLGGLGHFVSLIAETDSTYITGDPLVGRREYPKSEIWKKFQFTGLFLKAEKLRDNKPATRRCGAAKASACILSLVR
jgi:ABC-type bacteriocin/lantibiotic exporter with double-glycine peptidase domain